MCYRPLIQTGKHTHVDHCHTSGFVRDLLCHSCNTTLGKLHHSPTRCLQAADYLICHELKYQEKLR